MSKTLAVWPGPPRSAARCEPRVVTPGRSPCQHLFFNFPRRRSRRGRASGFPKRRCVSTRPRPARQHFFFNLVRFAFASRPVLRFHEAEGLSTRPRSARQHFFFKLPGNRFPPDRASGFPSCGGALLRFPADTVNTFFQLSRAALSRRPPCPGFPKRRGYLPDRIRPVNTFFQASGESSSPGPRFRLPVVRRCASTPRPRHRQHVFQYPATRSTPKRHRASARE